jgi:hypothetical protein
MENNTQQVTPPFAVSDSAAEQCRRKSDARTFWIALLTSVIVVALYHFGGGLYRIWCPEEEKEPGCYRGCKATPVMCPVVMMQHCPVLHGMCPGRGGSSCGEKRVHPRWNKEGKRGMFRRKGDPASPRHPGRHHFRKQDRSGNIAPDRPGKSAPAE